MTEQPEVISQDNQVENTTSPSIEKNLETTDAGQKNWLTKIFKRQGKSSQETNFTQENLTDKQLRQQKIKKAILIGLLIFRRFFHTFFLLANRRAVRNGNGKR